ncbi:MAG TPA: hypothetical protein GX691_06185 [Clostridia bacterium]|jgi:hypothetical protein|nr:hypothetical protein [Clostridia bacterium]
MKTLRKLKMRYAGKELLLGILGIWIMFFLIYFGLLSEHTLLIAAGMGFIGILMAYVVLVQ